MSKRYCGPCDEWVKGKECPKCGADTDRPERCACKGSRVQTDANGVQTDDVCPECEWRP